MDVKIFLETLRSILQDSGVNTAIVPGQEPQIGDTLNALLPVTEDGDKVLLEVMVAPYGDDLLLLQFFSTMIMKIGPGYEKLSEELLDWNLVCPMGAFGICRQLRQLYHKYTWPVDVDADGQEVAEQSATLLDIITEVIAGRFEEAVNISGHE